MTLGLRPTFRLAGQACKTPRRGHCAWHQLKLASTEYASIEAVREQANERIIDMRERNERIVESIKDTSEAQVQRAKDESELLRQQVELLQNSGDLTASVLGQVAQSQEAAQEMARAAEARTKQMEDDRSVMLSVQTTLSNALADAKAAQESCKDRLRKALSEAKEAVAVKNLLKDQQKRLQVEMAKYVEKEKEWRADRVAFYKLKEAYLGAVDDCKYAVEKCEELVDENEELQDYLEEANEELARRFLAQTAE